MLRALLLITAACLGYGSETLYDSVEYGFSMNPPAVAAHEGVQAAMFYLPAKDGFAASVNVNIQQYADSLEAYDKLTQGQFRQYKFTLLSRNASRDVLTYEYSGSMGGKMLHWYAKAFKRKDKIILITATGLEKHWDEEAASLKKSVDSLLLKD